MLSRIMPSNEHMIDRVMRVGIGAAGIMLVFVGPQTPLGWLGLIPLATGLMGSCPLYTLFGISTCRAKAR